MVVEELIALLGWDITGEADLKKFKQGMKDAERGLDEFAKRASAFAATIGVALTTGMAAFGKSVISTAAEFEKYEATLTTLEGSSDKAKKSLDWVSNFAKTTPFDVGGVTEAFIRLRAYGLDPLNGTLAAAGDASSAMGKGLMEGVEAIADAMTGENERLKGFGITASVAGDKVTYSWQENGKLLTKTLKKNGTEIVNFLKENFGNRFGGAMDRQSKTFSGIVSNLQDTWENFKRRVGNAGFFDAVKTQISRLSEYIADLDKNGTLDRWSNGLGQVFTTATNAIATFATRVALHLGTIRDLIEKHKGVWDTFKWALAGLAIYLFPATAAIFALGLVIDEVLGYMRGGDTVIGDFVNAIAKLLGADPEAVGKALGVIAAGAGALAVAALAVGGFTLALSPLTAGLIAFAGAFAAAKAGLEYLNSLKGNLDAKFDGLKVVDNPNAGITGGHGYDENGKFIYMNGNRRVDAPRVNPQEGFTDEALRWKNMQENAEGNLQRMTGNASTTAVVNDNKADNRNQSVNPTITINQTIQQASQAPGAAASATANAVAGAAGRISRAEKDDAF